MKTENTKDRLERLKQSLVKEEVETKQEVKEAKPKKRNKIEDVKLPEQKSLRSYINLHLTDKQNEFLKLYLTLRFNITNVCQELGMSRQNYYEWMETPEFRTAFENLREFIVDKSEEVLLHALDTMDAKTAQFILKTLGKKRGYGDSIDITSNGESISIPTINIILPSNDLDTKI